MAKKNKNQGILIAGMLAVLAICLLCWYVVSFYGVSSPKPCKERSENTLSLPALKSKSGPQEEYFPLSTGELIKHTYYTLSFNDSFKQANWVYYSLHLTGKEGKVSRTDDFREDKAVSTGSAKPSDYVKSGYDRGHLCPAGDMTHSSEAMSETFYMSNMSPQVPAFNRGIWKSLEEQVRQWGRREQIYVVTGPVFRDNKGVIGRSKVAVPGFFYKVIYAPSRQQMIAFVMPNAKSNQSLTKYVVSVDSVETLTGIDFFSQLPDSLESRLEARSSYAKW